MVNEGRVVLSPGLHLPPRPSSISSSKDLKLQAVWFPAPPPSPPPLPLPKVGMVYSWSVATSISGLARANQTHDRPRASESTPPSISVAAAGHSLAVDEEGQIWTWGRNNSRGGGGNWYTYDGSGQLGVRLGDVRPTLPARILLPPQHRAARFAAVASGRYHSAAVTEGGELLTWGSNDHGQLGRRAFNASRHEEPCELGWYCRDPWPRPVQGLPRVKRAALGRFNSLAIDEAGQIWVWGIDQCARRDWAAQRRKGVWPNALASAQPRRVPIREGGQLLNFTDASAGYVHWVAVDEGGGVWTCATADDGYSGMLMDVHVRGDMMNWWKEGKRCREERDLAGL